MQVISKVTLPIFWEGRWGKNQKKNLLIALIATAVSIVFTNLTIRLLPKLRIKEREVIHFENLQGLERDFQSIAYRTQDLLKRKFESYLMPNEGSPENIVPCLHQVTARGIFVSTGTERSFFNLIFADPEKCEGLVIVDINPQVKAYNDCLIMLIRISKDINEFNQLSADLDLEGRDEQFKDRVILIQSLLEKADLPHKLYYLKKLETLALVYFCFANRNWHNCDQFKEVDYTKNAKHFFKLKEYVDRGNVISVVGDMNNLQFLENRSIGVIDTSNIQNYTMIDLKGIGDCAPMVIWTHQDYRSTEYRCIKYDNQVLREEERKEFDERLGILISKGIISNACVSLMLQNLYILTSQKNGVENPDDILMGYNRATLEFFRKYEGRYWEFGLK